jgi:hypothetical protein
MTTLLDYNWQIQPNPIITGTNLYAPATIDNGGEWFIYCGGWRDPINPVVDRTYFISTFDRALSRGFTPLRQTLPDNGLFRAQNDPSIVRRDSHDWYMLLTATPAGAGTMDQIGWSRSSDGYTWQPAQPITWDTPVGSGGRPSVLWDSADGIFRMWFDGNVAGQNTVHHAISQDCVNWTVYEAAPPFPVPAYDVDVKLVGGTYFAVYRTAQPAGEPWAIRAADSPDGLTFTDRGTLLQPQPGMPWAATGLNNGCLTVDRFGKLQAILFGGCSAATLDNNSIGIALPGNQP